MRKLTFPSRDHFSPQDLFGAEVVIDPDLHEAYQVSVCRPFSLYPGFLPYEHVWGRYITYNVLYLTALTQFMFPFVATNSVFPLCSFSLFSLYSLSTLSLYIYIFSPADPQLDQKQ